MNQALQTTPPRRSLWLRLLLMVLMAMVYQLCGSLMFLVAVVQLVICMLSDGPNARLQAFGRSLANYLRQLAQFFTFASEDLPFPFADWPPAD